MLFGNLGPLEDDPSSFCRRELVLVTLIPSCLLLEPSSYVKSTIADGLDVVAVALLCRFMLKSHPWFECVIDVRVEGPVSRFNEYVGRESKGELDLVVGRRGKTEEPALDSFVW